MEAKLNAIDSQVVADANTAAVTENTNSQVDINVSTADIAPQQKYKNVYCMPVIPRTRPDEEIFSKKNKHTLGGAGKCPCCD